MRLITSTPFLALVLGLPALAQNVGTNYCQPAVANSTGLPGTVAGTGSAVAGGNPLTLTATQLPVNQFGYFLVSQSQALVVGPGGSQGTLCLGAPIGRFNAQVGNSGASGSIGINVDTLNIPMNPSVAIQAGETWNFQLWYRDLNPSTTSNFTDGLSIAFTSGGGVTADFTASVTQGTNPLVVQFTDLSAGATTWDWDFGDGGTSTAQNPGHSYLTRGVYTVSLTVTGPGGSDMEVKANYIQVDQGFTDVYGFFTQNNIDPSTGQQTALSCVDCHGLSGFGGLSLPDQPTAYANLVGVASNCFGAGGLPRVDPGNSGGSMLYQKLAGTQSCGSSMPFGAVFAGDLQVVQDWIDDGAQQ